MESLLKFNIEFNNIIDSINKVIEYNALVGIEPQITVDNLNQYKDIQILTTDMFLNEQGFDNTKCRTRLNIIDSIPFIDIIVFHNKRLMSLDNFIQFVNDGCQLGYTIKLKKKGVNGKYVQNLYLKEIVPDNPSLYGPDKDNSIVFDDHIKAENFVSISQIPRNIYDVFLIQVHDKPFKDREIFIP